MRVTDFRLADDGTVVPEVMDTPQWQPFPAWEDQPLEGVELVEVDAKDDLELQLVRIARGGHFVMHSSPALAFCQVVRGAGTLALPGDRLLRYEGPELYVFRPHTLHEWREVTADTVLSVCLVHR